MVRSFVNRQFGSAGITEEEPGRQPSFRNQRIPLARIAATLASIHRIAFDVGLCCVDPQNSGLEVIAAQSVYAVRVFRARRAACSAGCMPCGPQGPGKVVHAAL